MSLPNLGEIVALLKGDAGVLNMEPAESFFTNGMSTNLSELIDRVGSGGDFTEAELDIFKKQAEEFASLHC